ncbi:MAG: outer membrane protein [Bermanella sp.]|jgi:outer membrane protein
MFLSTKFFIPRHLLTMSLAMAATQYSWAIDSINESDWKDTYLSVGTGYIQKSSIYLNGENKSSEYVSIDAYWGPMFFIDYKIGAYFAEYNNWAFSLSYGLDNREGTDRGDSKILKDLPNLSSIFLASINAELHHDAGDLAINYSIDTSNEHNGKMIDIDYSYPWIINKHTVSFELSASWISKEVSQYYYGVNAADTKENRPSYELKDEINWSYGLNYSYYIRPNIFSSASIIFNNLSNGIKNSPIVEKPNSNSLLFGINYIF